MAMRDGEYDVLLCSPITHLTPTAKRQSERPKEQKMSKAALLFPKGNIDLAGYAAACELVSEAAREVVDDLKTRNSPLTQRSSTQAELSSTTSKHESHL
jgi:hypothetical protein